MLWNSTVYGIFQNMKKCAKQLTSRDVWSCFVNLVMQGCHLLSVTTFPTCEYLNCPWLLFVATPCMCLAVKTHFFGKLFFLKAFQSAHLHYKYICSRMNQGWFQWYIHPLDEERGKIIDKTFRSSYCRCDMVIAKWLDIYVTCCTDIIQQEKTEGALGKTADCHTSLYGSAMRYIFKYFSECIWHQQGSVQTHNKHIITCPHRQSFRQIKMSSYWQIFNTDCTGSYQNDNFQCSQWLKFHWNGDISILCQGFYHFLFVRFFVEKMTCIMGPLCASLSVMNWF